MAKSAQVAVCIGTILSLNVLIVKARTISNKKDANGLEPANYGIMWLNTEASADYFSKHRDWIISFNDKIADGSHVDIYSINLFPSSSILSFTKQRGINTYTDTLLKLNLVTLNESRYVSSTVIEHTIQKQWYSKVYDSGLANIAVYLISPGTLLQGHLDTLLIKTYVITHKNGKPIDEAFTPLATDIDHVIYLEQMDDMNQLLTQDTQMLCMTNQYYDDNRCHYCSDLNCERAEDGGIFFQTNIHATRDCIYWKPDVESKESTPTTTTESHTIKTTTGEEATTESPTFEDITTDGTTSVNNEITTASHEGKPFIYITFLAWICTGIAFVTACVLLGQCIIARLLQNRNTSSVAHVARSVLISIGSIGSKNSATNHPKPGARARLEPSAPPEDLLSIGQCSIVSSPSTRPSSSPSESSDTENDGQVYFIPGPSVTQTDEVPEYFDLDERNEDNESDSTSGNEEQSLLVDEISEAAVTDATVRPNDAFDLPSEDGQEERPLLENERSDLISEDGDFVLDPLKHKEKDVWTGQPFRDIHNSLCTQNNGLETQLEDNEQNTEESSEETSVKCLDKISVQATS